MPDGYTVFLTTNTVNSVTPYLFKILPFHSIKDFMAIAQVYCLSFVLAASASADFSVEGNAFHPITKFTVSIRLNDAGHDHPRA